MKYTFALVLSLVLLIVSISLNASTYQTDTIPVLPNTSNNILYESEEYQSYIKTASDDCFLIEGDGKYGLECKGKQIIPIEYSIDKSFEDKFFVFRKGLTCGIYNVLENRWVFPLGKYTVKNAGNKHFIIDYANDERLIDLEGKDIFPMRYKEIKYAGQNDFFIVKEKSQDGYKRGLFSISKNEFILFPKYDQITTISNSESFRIKEDKGYRLYNSQSNTSSVNQYDKILDCVWTKEAKVIVKKDEYFGVINMQEDIIVPIEFSSVTELHADGNVLFSAVSKAGKTSIFTANGRIVLEDFDSIKNISHNKILISKDEAYGLATIKDDSLRFLLDVEYDKITNAFGVIVVSKDGKYNIFCDRNSEFNKDLPFDDVQRLKTRTIIAKVNGYLTTVNSFNCTVEPLTEFTSFEYLNPNHPSVKSYHYMKAKKETGSYYLTNGKLITISEQTFHDIIATNGHYIFFKDNNEKIGVYHGQRDDFIIEAKFDAIEFNVKEIYLSKDGQKGIFRHGKVIY